MKIRLARLEKKMRPRAPAWPVVFVMQPGETMAAALARAQREGNRARLVVPAIPSVADWQRRAIPEQAALLLRCAVFARL